MCTVSDEELVKIKKRNTKYHIIDEDYKSYETKKDKNMIGMATIHEVN